MVVPAQATVIEERVLATNRHRKGGYLQLARVVNCLGLGEARPLTSEINPSRRGTKGPAPLLPDLDSLESPTDPFLGLKHQNMATVLS